MKKEMIVIEVDPVTLPRVSIRPAMMPAFMNEFAFFSEITFVMIEEQQVSTDRAIPSTRHDPATNKAKGYKLTVNCDLKSNAIKSKIENIVSIFLSSNFFFSKEGSRAAGRVKKVKRKKIKPDTAEVLLKALTM